MKDELPQIVLAVLLVGAVVVGVLSLSGVGAAVGNELTNQTVSVGEDTDGLRVLAENTTGELNVTVSGIDADGNETQVATGTLNATSGPNATDTYEYRNVNATLYPDYLVTVTGDAAETLDVTKLQVVQPGGGGLISDVGQSSSALGLLALLGLLGVFGALNRRR